MANRAIPRAPRSVTSGDLIHEIQILQPVLLEDEGGGKTEGTPTVLSTDFFSIQPANANTVYMYAQRKITVTHTAYSRYNADVPQSTNLRLFWPDKNRTFAVHGIRNLEERDRLFIWTLEETTDLD